MADTFCKGCGLKMEWHPHRDGRLVAIEPKPHPEGLLYFGAGLKLTPGKRGERPRMYRYHVEGCANPEKALRRQPGSCGREDCERQNRHFHCFRCGSTEHFANACDDYEDT